MANQCENKVYISGSNEEMKKFKEAIKTEYKQDFDGWDLISNKEDVVSGHLLCHEVVTKYNPSPVLNLAYSLSNKFPELQFKVEYREVVNAFEGVAYIKNGNSSHGHGGTPGLLELQKYGWD